MTSPEASSTDVAERGETAVRDYAERFDAWAPEAGFRVSQSELDAAERGL
jgi:histidinol dehydrogenase